MNQTAGEPEPVDGGLVGVDDGHYFVVDGRRWRCTDPSIPDKLEAELVAELMAARRAVGAAKGDPDGAAVARRRVQDAKVALGERGEPWWETPSAAGRSERLGSAMRTLLRHRQPEKTICPSDAARVVGGEDWREAMEPAREVARQLSATGVLEVRQKGVRVDLAEVTGPIRLARGPGWE